MVCASAIITARIAGPDPAAFHGMVRKGAREAHPETRCKGLITGHNRRTSKLTKKLKV